MGKIGLDIGFGDVKVAIPYRRGDRISIRTLKFPTAIGRAKHGIVDLESSGRKTYIVGKDTYHLGTDALFCQDIFDTRDREFLERFSPLLTYKALENIRPQDRHNDLVLCVGIPLGYYRDHRKNIARVLGNISVCNQNITPKTVDVRAQGQGVYFDYIFENSGIADRSKMNINALILDIGFNTVDVLGLVNGRPTMEWSDMFTKEGVSRIAEDLKTHIKKEFDREESDQVICRILEDGQIRHFGETHDLSKIIKELTRVYTERFVQFIRSSRWNKFLGKSDHLIIAGGGAYFVADAFKANYRDGFVVVPAAPEYSNARGFLKFNMGMLR